MQLPWPFVTQGSQPIHVYDSVDYINHCFSNYGSGYSIDNYVYLKDYGVDYPTVKTGYLLSLLTRTVELEITIPDSGFAFIRQHLDDGIKGWSLDFNGDGIIDMIDYGKDNANNAADPATGRVLVPNLFEHPFYMWGFKCSADDPACDITPPSSDIYAKPQCLF